MINVNEPQFEQEVIQKSKTVPVLVDFWASWCGPCRMLGPLLEEVEKDYQGAFALVKVDTDSNQSIAKQFRVSSIPQVSLFQDGQMVDQFVGVLPEDKLRTFLDKYCVSPNEEKFSRALDYLNALKFKKAEKILSNILRVSPNHSKSKLLLGRIYFVDNRRELAKTLFQEMIAGRSAVEEAEAFLSLIEFIESHSNTKNEKSGLKSITANQGDVDPYLDLVSVYLKENKTEPALNYLLKAIEIDKNYQSSIARKTMLAVFNMVGQRNPLSEEYRTKLARILN